MKKSQVSPQQLARQEQRRNGFIDAARIAEERGSSMPGVFSLQAAATFYGDPKAVKTISRACAAGDLKSFVVGNRRKILFEDLIAWIKFLKARSDAGNPVVYAPRDQPEPHMPADNRCPQGRRSKPQQEPGEDA